MSHELFPDSLMMRSSLPRANAEVHVWTAIVGRGFGASNTDS
jgi:hypothetical protein